MKKSVVIITVVFVLIALSCVCANAKEGEMIYDMSNVFDSLSDDIKQSLQNMGVDLGDFSKLANLSFENVMGEILSLALGNISSPLKGLSHSEKSNKSRLEFSAQELTRVKISSPL